MRWRTGAVGPLEYSRRYEASKASFQRIGARNGGGVAGENVANMCRAGTRAMAAWLRFSGCVGVEIDSQHRSAHPIIGGRLQCAAGAAQRVQIYRRAGWRGKRARFRWQLRRHWAGPGLDARQLRVARPYMELTCAQVCGRDGHRHS